MQIFINNIKRASLGMSMSIHYFIGSNIIIGHANIYYMYVLSPQVVSKSSFNGWCSRVVEIKDSEQLYEDFL